MKQKNSQEFSFLEAIFLSFYSRKLYQDIVKNWARSGYFFTLKLSICFAVLLITLIATALITLNPKDEINNITNGILGDGKIISRELALNRIFSIIASLPEMEYRNGKLHTKEPQIFVITDPVSNRAFININTENKEAPLPLNRFKHYTIIKGDGVMHDSTFIKFSQQDRRPLEMITNILKQFPLLTVKNDLITSDKKQPYLITANNTDKATIVIDTNPNPKYTKLDDGQYLLINNDSITIRNPITKNVSSVFIRELDNNYLYNAIYSTFKIVRNYTLVLLLIAIPLTTLLIFAILASMVFLLSLITQMFADSLNPSLSKHDIVKLSSVALFPALIIALLILVSTGLSAILFFPIAGFYMYFSVKSTLES